MHSGLVCLNCSFNASQIFQLLLLFNFPLNTREKNFFLVKSNTNNNNLLTPQEETISFKEFSLSIYYIYMETWSH